MVPPRYKSMETVPVVSKTLDSFNLTNVSLIKIDTEGYEKSVVVGARNTIEKHKPVIVAELSTKEQFNEFKYL